MIRITRTVFFIALMLVLVANTIAETHFFDRQFAKIEDVTIQQLRSLSQQKLHIDKVVNSTVYIYLSEEEYSSLLTTGYDVAYIVDPSRVMFEELRRRTQGSLDEMDEFHTYEELRAELEQIASDNPDICNLLTIGESIQGRSLMMMEISDNVLIEEDEPEFAYISTMHGDEVVGMENCVNFINKLVNEYDTNPEIQQLVDETHIYIMPDMNPDGTMAGVRFNADGDDLNRSFPDHIADPYNLEENRPHEVVRLMRFFGTESPVLAANFHGGIILVNYPFDSNPDFESVNTPSPDDDWYIDISTTYSALNDSMWNNPYFENGITNGAEWYTITGGMQDYTLMMAGCAHVTIELSNPKWPDPSTLPTYWDQNEESMVAYLKKVHQGIRGIVTDSETGDILEATIKIVDNYIEVYTDPDVGDYYRLTLPGSYDIEVACYGYDSVIVENITVVEGELTRADVSLTRSIPGYLFEGFDDGEAGFTHEAVSTGSPDQWHLSTAHTSTASNSWKFGDSGNGNYASDTDAALITPVITLEEGSILTFWHYMDAEISSTRYPYGYDGGRVEILADGATEWVPISPEGDYPYMVRNPNGNGALPHESWFYSGFIDGKEATFDLSGYSGDIRLRFRFVSDGNTEREGWCIDDFEISSIGVATLVFNPNPVIFPVTDVNESANIPLQITNTGNIDYQLESISIQPDHSFMSDWDNQPLTIQPDSTFELLVTFSPNIADSIDGEILFEGSINYNIPVSGRGIGVGYNEHEENLPTEFAVNDPYPNPFNQTTSIVVALPEASILKLEVVNILGQKIAGISYGRQSAGYHKFVFNAENLSSGIYFIKAEVQGKLNSMKKIVLIQ
jgi:Zinc carboxypeptidase/Secretion system C-terminal sorting domain/Cep192 domain 4